MILEITNFEIQTRSNGDRIAAIEAVVEVLVDTYYSEPVFVNRACVTEILLSDDDTRNYDHAAERMELAEDVSSWDYADDGCDAEWDAAPPSYRPENAVLEMMERR